MFKKLSFILALAIFLTACGAAAPMDTDAPAEIVTNAPTVQTEALMETVPTAGEQETPAAPVEPEVSAAEYFSFTKYSNTKSNDDGLDLLIENRSIPSFTSPDAARSQWVGDILAGIERDYTADSANLYEYAVDFVRENGTDYFYSFSNYQQMGVARHDETMTSLIAVSSLHSGGSHPNSVQVAYNLDISNQRILRLEDIIEEKAAPELARMVREAVDEKFAVIDGGNGLFEDYGDTIANSMVYGNMTPYWYLNDQGLVVFYNQYELGPYAVGIINAELSYADLEGILQADYFPVQPGGTPGDLVLTGEGVNRISVTLDQEDKTMLVGVKGTVYQVQLSEVLWMEGTPISQDMRFSARSLSETDVLEIIGGYADENRSFVIEFHDGMGEQHIYYIKDGSLSPEP